VVCLVLIRGKPPFAHCVGCGGRAELLTDKAEQRVAKVTMVELPPTSAEQARRDGGGISVVLGVVMADDPFYDPYSRRQPRADGRPYVERVKVVELGEPARSALNDIVYTLFAVREGRMPTGVGHLLVMGVTRIAWVRGAHHLAAAVGGLPPHAKLPSVQHLLDASDLCRHVWERLLSKGGDGCAVLARC